MKRNYDFVNSYKLFCRRRNSHGIIVKSGVGMLRASDLKTNVIRLCRGITPGQNEWRLQPQNETALNAHNKNLMRTLKHQIAEQLHIGDQLDIDDGMEVNDFDNHLKLNVSHGWKPAEIKPYMPGKRPSVEKATGFELFRIKERGVPTEFFELDNNSDKIIAFAWEPKGHRFAVIHGDGDISFYTVRTTNNLSCVCKLTTLKGRQANALFWSPAGRFIVLAGLKDRNGQMEFYNVDDLETMAVAEHSKATDVMWDPTGRFLATVVTSVHEMGNGNSASEMGTGFRIWSFDGKQILKVSKDQLYQFRWRPRPWPSSSLLGPNNDISTEPTEAEDVRRKGDQSSEPPRGDGTVPCLRRRKKHIKLSRWLKWLW